MTQSDAGRRASVDALDPADAPLPAEASRTAADPSAPSGAMRFAMACGPADEPWLEDYWRRFSEPGLERLIDATLRHGFAMSAATLDLRRHAENGRDAYDEQREWFALAAFYAVRVREVADTARMWFYAASLHERLALIESALSEIFAERSGARIAARVSVAELHARRVRLQARLESFWIALAQRSGLPVDHVRAALAQRGLPAGRPAQPGAGTPEALLRRRPDLLAQRHREAAGDTAAEREARRLDYERACACACAQVETAFVALRGLCAEWSPINAAASAAEAQACRARAALHERDARRADPECADALGRAERQRLACRDREIEIRGAAYLALIDLLEALGGGWPANMSLEDA